MAASGSVLASLFCRPRVRGFTTTPLAFCALLLGSAALVPAAQAQSATADPTDQTQWNSDVYPEPYYVATPDQIIRQGIDRLIGFLMGSPDADEQSVRHFVGREIAPYFDFQYMSRWAAGPLYHRLSPEHRVALAHKLSSMFLDALSRNLGTLERPLPRVDVFPARPGNSMSEARVYVRVMSAQAPPVRLEFRFYWGQDGWKVYDVSANGASAVAFYRGYFTSALRTHGPDAVLR